MTDLLGRLTELVEKRNTWPGVIGMFIVDNWPEIKAALSRQEGMVKIEAEALLGAVTRGWCHPKNEQKVFDPDLAIAIAAEVNALLAAAPQGTEK